MNVTMHKSALQDTRRVFPYQGLFSLVTLLLAVSPLWLPGPEAWAQGPAPETPGNAKTPSSVAPADPQQEAQTDQPIPLEEAPNRAETTIAELDTLLPRDTSRQTLDRVSSETDRALQEIKSHLAKTRQVLAGRPNVRALQKVESELSELLTHLSSLKEELDEQLETLRTSLERIDRISRPFGTRRTNSRRLRRTLMKRQ